MTDKPFYFVRHGQSQANADGVPAGTMDSPLTQQGMREAEIIRSIVENLPVRPGAIITSNLSRAKQTASIINRDLRLPVREEPLLAEQHYGDVQGMPKDKIIAQYGSDWSARPPNGETFADFTARVVKALKTVLSNQNGLPLIVGHGGMAHALGRVYGINLRGVHNCAFLHFVTDGKSPWIVLDHEGEPFETGHANMDAV